MKSTLVTTTRLLALAGMAGAVAIAACTQQSTTAKAEESQTKVTTTSSGEKKTTTLARVKAADEAKAVKVVELKAQPGGGSERRWVIADGDGEIIIQDEHGKVTATKDGKKIAGDRVRAEGGHVIVLDESGKTLFDSNASGQRRARVAVAPVAPRAPMAPQPPKPPKAPKAMVFKDGQGGMSGLAPLSAITLDADTATFVMNKDGDKVEVKMEDGKVTSAKHNGKDLPKENVKHEDGKLTVLGADGKTIAEFDHAKVHAMPHTQWRGAEGNNLFAVGGVADGPKPDVMIGVKLDEVPSALAGHLGIKKGLMVTGVAKELPAAKAGLKPYDVITAVNGKDITEINAIRKTLAESKAKAGDKVTLTVVSNGQKKDVSLTADAFDQEKMSGSKWDEIEPEAHHDMHFEVPDFKGLEDFKFDFKMPEGQWHEMGPEVKAEIERAMKAHKDAAGAHEQAGAARELAMKQRERAVVERDTARRAADAARRDAERMREREVGRAGGRDGNDPAQTERVRELERQMKELEESLRKLEKTLPKGSPA